ncbi:hypothetical protein [Mycolicibacterium litorale]|uniref:phosphoribosyltransferase-like protein n=1 Tax=Mycolicibacterium litorale TaxID=758802 RepID=UPI0039A2BC18
MSSQIADVLADYKANVEALAEQLLAKYVEQLASARPAANAKEFNDPVWGTLYVNAFEVLVLDSPLLQRLRRIRQLGVAHLVYPGAVHTRFEHGLGVSHQVSQLAESLERHSVNSPGQGEHNRLDDWHIAILRLAAICHDTGHGVMSHVSENALDNDATCADIRLAFTDYLEDQKVRNLGEIASYFLLGSPAFGRMLTTAAELVPDGLPVIRQGQSQADKIKDYQTKLSRLIVGRAIDDEYPLIHELISGPFDADKLDYMSRDAMMCGLPVVTDIPRLIQKVRSRRLGQSELPAPIGATVRQNHSYVITGIARSGARTLDELSLARTLMFDKVYRHQKVRAAEAMVTGIFDQLLQVAGAPAAMLPFRVCDEELLGLTVRSAQDLLDLDEDQIQDNTIARHIRTAVDLAERLRRRELLSRCFAFSERMPLDPHRADAGRPAATQKLKSTIEDPRRRLDLVRLIVAEAAEIASVIGEPLPNSVVPEGDVIPYVWMSAPRTTDGTGKVGQIGHAWLIGSSEEELRQARDEYAETDLWSNSYVATRDLGLIFCPREIRRSMYLAAESVVRREFGLRVPRTMLAFAKQDAAALEVSRRALADSGWYDGKPHDLRPTPTVLTLANAAARLRALIVENLGGYQGPLTTDATGEARTESLLTPDRVANWIKQFPTDELAESALCMLEGVRHINRSYLNSALEDYLQQDSERGPSILVPFGQPKDSSSVLTYMVRDLGSRFDFELKPITDAVFMDQPIIMIDDYVGRGSAGIEILENWLGAVSTQELNQSRVEPLPARVRPELLKADITIVFANGKQEGAENLRNRAVALGFENLKTHIYNTDIPSLHSPTVIPDEGRRSRLIDFCRTQGAKAIMESGKSEAVSEERALGYGNDALLLVGSFNTPTATLTCIWKGSSVWTPLLPRLAKN